MNSGPAQLAAFVRVIDRGGFAAAAEGSGLTASGLSKAVTRLEDRLGVRLLQRTTRRLILTPEGETMLARARDILAAIEAAEAEVTAARGKPRGLVRLNTGTAYAKHRLAPLLPGLHARYPDITLDLSIADRRVDVIGEQVDIAIRTGPLGDSSLVARRIGEATRIIVASPDYLKRMGIPRSQADLGVHTCLTLSGLARLADWPLRVDGRVVLHPVKAAITSDSADLLLDMVLSGLGIARLASFLMEDALADGRLVPVMADIHVPEVLPVTALMPPGRQHWPRVRAVLDYLVENASVTRSPG